jgi:hypothetical protein
MTTIEIESISDFLQLLEKVDPIAGNFIYRGQGNSNWRLVPGLERLRGKIRGGFIDNNLHGLEKSILENFENLSFNYSNTNREILDLISLGQHYGLPTRFLDWTRNPLIALYFSVKHDASVNGSVWMLNVNEKFRKTSPSYFDLNSTDFYLHTPKSLGERILNQSSLFTVHPIVDEKFVDLIEFMPSDSLLKIDIKHNIFAKIRYELARIGIHDMHIYPDLSGVSSFLTKKFFCLNDSDNQYDSEISY